LEAAAVIVRHGGGKLFYNHSLPVSGSMTTAAGTRLCVSAAVIQGRLPAICRSVVTHIHQTVAMLFTVTVIARNAAVAPRSAIGPTRYVPKRRHYRFRRLYFIAHRSAGRTGDNTIKT